MKKDKKNNPETLGGRLKGYESDYEREIDPELHIVCRIDGHKFSKFTKGFLKPFDEILSNAMVLTTIDLLEEFNAVTSYTQSDEITLIIPSLKDITVDNRESHKHKIHKRIREDWKHEYSGRVQKMSSLIAGFTTMKFNKHLKDEADKFYDSKCINNPSKVDNETYENYVSYIQNIYSKKIGNAWFDCRVYGVDTDEEAFNSVLWRIRDAEKNSRSMFAQSFCSHKELQGKTGLEQVEYCKEKTGKDWNNIEDKYKYGVLVKKEQYEKECKIYISNRRKGEEPLETTGASIALRTRFVQWAQHLVYSEDNVNLIMRKYK